MALWGNTGSKVCAGPPHRGSFSHHPRYVDRDVITRPEKDVKYEVATVARDQVAGG